MSDKVANKSQLLAEYLHGSVGYIRIERVPSKKCFGTQEICLEIYPKFRDDQVRSLGGYIRRFVCTDFWIKHQSWEWQVKWIMLIIWQMPNRWNILSRSCRGGTSLQWLVPTKCGPRKNNRWTNNQCSRITDACEEWRLACLFQF